MVEDNNMQEAVESSRKAKTWCWIAIGVTLALVLPYFLLLILRAAGFRP